MGTQRGIEVNPNQVKVIFETPALNSKKELQRLIGHLATLGRFITHFTDKLRPFFLTFRRQAQTAGQVSISRHLKQPSATSLNRPF